MRCDEVQRERSAPSGLDPSIRSEHLASCPSCASWMAGADALDRIWDATRPVEPSPERFDALWARVNAGALAPAAIPFAGRSRWSRWPLVVGVLAQAAAILAGSALLLRPSPVVASVHDITANEGHTVFVTLGSRTVSVEERPQVVESETDTVAVELDIFNYMESLEKVALQ